MMLNGIDGLGPCEAYNPVSKIYVDHTTEMDSSVSP